MQTSQTLEHTFVKIKDETIRLDRIVRYHPKEGTVGTVLLNKGAIEIVLADGTVLAFYFPTKKEAEEQIARLDKALASAGRTFV